MPRPTNIRAQSNDVNEVAHADHSAPITKIKASSPYSFWRPNLSDNVPKKTAPTAAAINEAPLRTDF